MRPAVLLAISLLYSLSAVCQDSYSSLMDTEWNVGTVLLPDGTQLNGRVKYNDKLRFIAWQPYNNKDVSRVFREDEVVAVDLFDQQNGRRRKFFSLSFTDSETGEVQIQMFELLKEFSDFAVLLRREPVRGLKAAYRGSPFYPIYELPMICSSNNNGAPFIDQKEIIYFMNESGSFEIYYCKSRGERSRKGKLPDRELLKKYMSIHYDAVKDYARHNRVQFANTNDLVRMLNYYELLLSESASANN